MLGKPYQLMRVRKQVRRSTRLPQLERCLSFVLQDASELVIQLDASSDFDFTEDFLGLFPPTPKPAGAMAAAASDISRMLWQNDTDVPMPPKDFSVRPNDCTSCANHFIHLCILSDLCLLTP